MTIVRVGSNEKFASNWDQVFVKKSKKAAKPAQASTKKKAAKEDAPKKSAKPAKASTKKKAAKPAPSKKAAKKKAGKKR